MSIDRTVGAELESGERARASVSDLGERQAFRFGRRALLLDLAVWSVAALFFATFRIVGSATPVTPRTAAELAVFCFLTSYSWAALTPFVFWAAHRWRIDHPRWALHTLVLIALGFALSALAILFGDVIQMYVLGNRPVGGWNPSLTDVVLRRWYIGEFMTYSVVLAAGLAWDYFARYRERLEETIRLAARNARMEAAAARLEADSAQLQRQLAEARIELLRSQLNPHFLFNTLNGVAALIDDDPRGVRRMLALLSELMHSALQPPAEAEVPLADELRLAERYLELLEIRYQGRLETLVSADPDSMDALVPSSILQPIVENAVKHGVGKAGGYGRIEVRARRVEESLVVDVYDSGPVQSHDRDPEASLEPAGWGIGLRYTRARLEELYGSWQGFELRPVEGGGTVAEIVLPYHTRAELRQAEESTVA
jgi:two-component system, LytTR family, sensor kinase